MVLIFQQAISEYVSMVTFSFPNCFESLYYLIDFQRQNYILFYKFNLQILSYSIFGILWIPWTTFLPLTIKFPDIYALFIPKKSFCSLKLLGTFLSSGNSSISVKSENPHFLLTSLFYVAAFLSKQSWR